MYKYFLTYYQDKTEEELLAIVASRKSQHKDAVKAATEILHQKFGHEASIRQKKKIKRTTFRKFTRSLSWRELWSICASALFFLAINTILVDLGFVYYVGKIWPITLLTTYAFSIHFVHYWYQKEHGRRNRYWPRVMQTFLLTSIILVITGLKLTWVSHAELGYLPQDVPGIIFGVAFISLITEGIVSTLYRLKAFIWQT